MKQSVNLNEVQQQFEQWRQVRGKRKAPIPEALRQQALLLCEQHPISQVAQVLRINYSMIKAWRQAQVSADFVPLLLSPPAPVSALQVTLSHPGGTQLHVQGLNSNELYQLLHRLMTNAAEVA